MHEAAPAGVLLRGVRHLQRVSTPARVSLARLQLVPQSVPDQPAAGKLRSPQDVPRMRARSLALQMHGLQTAQTSQRIHPLTERPRQGFPHPLQDLRNVHRMQASLLRPSVHGPGHTALYEMRRSDNSAGVLHMLQDTRQENVPCFSVGMEINHTKIP